MEKMLKLAKRKKIDKQRKRQQLCRAMTPEKTKSESEQNAKEKRNKQIDTKQQSCQRSLYDRLEERNL